LCGSLSFLSESSLSGASARSSLSGPLAVSPLAVSPLAVSPLAVSPLAVSPLAALPLAMSPGTLSPLPPRIPSPTTKLVVTLVPLSACASVRFPVRKNLESQCPSIFTTQRHLDEHLSEFVPGTRICFISRPCARVTIWNTMSPLVWRNFGAPVALATTLYVGFSCHLVWGLWGVSSQAQAWVCCLPHAQHSGARKARLVAARA